MSFTREQMQDARRDAGYDSDSSEHDHTVKINLASTMLYDARRDAGYDSDSSEHDHTVKIHLTSTMLYDTRRDAGYDSDSSEHDDQIQVAPPPITIAARQDELVRAFDAPDSLNTSRSTEADDRGREVTSAVEVLLELATRLPTPTREWIPSDASPEVSLLPPGYRVATPLLNQYEGRGTLPGQVPELRV